MMRLRAFAGFAALGAAAADFEDDDLNFLRLLSTNASGNATTAPATTVVDANATTAPATTVPATTVVDPNATTVPATTVPATTVVDANATTVPATTVGATTVVDPNATTVPATTAVSVTKAGETKASDATTVAATGGAGETTVAPSRTEPVQGDRTTAPPAVTVTKFCSAEAYQSVGLTPPATFLDTMADFALKVSCSDETKTNQPGDPSTLFYKAGTRATTSANLAKCASPATVTQITCGGQSTLAWWQGEVEDLYEKQGALMKCCGAAPGFSKPTLAKVNSVGTLKWENFTDSKCTTSSTHKPDWPSSDITSANPHTFKLGTCVDLGGAHPGYYMNFALCNTTHYGQYEYFNTPCTDAEFSGAAMGELGQCQPGSSYNGNITGWEKWTCDSEAPTKKTFSTTLKIEFAGLAGMSATQLTAVKTTYETKSLETFKTALAVPTAEITPTHTYSGALASRRRLSGATRRLSGSGGVTSVFVTTLPAAAADAAQAVIVAKTTGSSAALTPAAFKTTIETELASNDATKAFASNITATVAAPVVSLPAPAPTTTTPGGTTSGAMTNLLGFGSALLMATCLLM